DLPGLPREVGSVFLCPDQTLKDQSQRYSRDSVTSFPAGCPKLTGGSRPCRLKGRSEPQPLTLETCRALRQSVQITSRSGWTAFRRVGSSSHPAGCVSTRECHCVPLCDHRTKHGRTPVEDIKPSAARAYDYMLGGKDHYDVDREFVSVLDHALPDPTGLARTNRAFLERAVEWLARDAGVEQFLDCGS